ncbi:MAG: Rrf2 family transcriptional regulator [Saprospiraceae bacterium]|nr:Rrf2 family transcriptional regulator [Saprospiraceae bacterium]
MFSKSCKYAIRAVLYLAVHSSEEKKFGAKEIAESLDIPKPFLAKLLQQLSRQGLVSSAKGPSGGFFLNDEGKAIPLRQIIEAIDGPEIFSSCILGLPVCSSENPCPMHTKAIAYREGLLKLVEDQAICDLAKRIQRMKLSLGPHDYNVV